MNNTLKKTPEDRYNLGYSRSCDRGWSIDARDERLWTKWIAENRPDTDYVRGRLEGWKAFRLKRLINGNNE